MKRRVYIETTIVSYLASRRSGDLLVAAHQFITKKWWEEESAKYEMVISDLVVEEAGMGAPEVARVRLEHLNDLPALRITDGTRLIARRLLQERAIPASVVEDALHVAVCAMNGVDYLLTWNCRHLANPQALLKVARVLNQMEYICPQIITPEQLMETEDVD